jgi:YebC/PmpR family DNA-binding regulatory protein
MSGHNKWSKIARKKGVNDQKRGKIFSKIIKEITVAAKTGGADPSANMRLRSAIALSKSNNMPKDLVERAIKKGAGSGNDVNYEEITYEGYGPGGTALLVQCLTDNRVRTVGEIRHIITKHGGNLASTGSVSFMFDKKGLIEISKSKTTEEKIVELAIEAGADDVSEEADTFDIVTSPENFESVKQAIEIESIEILSGEITLIPQNNVSLDPDKAQTIMKLLEALEDLDDVQNVYSNFDFEE